MTFLTANVLYYYMPDNSLPAFLFVFAFISWNKSSMGTLWLTVYIQRVCGLNEWIMNQLIFLIVPWYLAQTPGSVSLYVQQGSASPPC